MGMDFKQICNQINLSIRSEWADENPNMEGMPQGSTHYKVTLTVRRDGKRRQLTTFFSQGPAFCREPEAPEVLDCLLSDGSSGRQSFEDFCSDFGYDTDSRRCERTWKACRDTDRKLDQFLGYHRDALESSDR